MTLSAVLLEYGIPLTLGVSGWRVAWLSTNFDGLKGMATFFFGLILMFCTPIYALWGTVIEDRRREEARRQSDFEREFEARKPKPIEPPLTPLAYETTTAYKTRSLGLEGPKLRAVAAALIGGFPFSEDYLVDKAKLISGRECRTFKERCLARGLARWKDEKHHRKGVEMTPERVGDTWAVIANGGLKRVGTPPPRVSISAPTR